MERKERVKEENREGRSKGGSVGSEARGGLRDKRTGCMM